LSPLVSVEDEPDDPTRLMDRSRREQSIFNAPTKILPRVRRGGVLRSVGANVLAYTQRPAVNLVLLLMAGLLLVGLGFVLGRVRQDSRPVVAPEAIVPIDKVTHPAPMRTATPAVSAAPSVNAISVSSLPLAPPVPAAKDPTSARPTGAAARGSSGETPLLPDRPPAGVETAPEPKQTNVPPVRNPGF
jgi:hypothetical protein